MRALRRCAGMAIAAGALLLGGCSNWLSVDNPGVINNDALDPVADAALLARSAQQNLTSAYGHVIVYSSWFTGETDVSTTRGRISCWDGPTCSWRSNSAGAPSSRVRR